MNNFLQQRPSASADGDAHSKDVICESIDSQKPATGDFGAPVSPVISPAVNPESREKSITETRSERQSGNQSGNGNTKVNCYECKHRRELAGDCHSSCGHPAASSVALMLFAAGKSEFNTTQIHVRGNTHGVRSGWFMWPLNFDPIWLEICNGFESK